METVVFLCVCLPQAKLNPNFFLLFHRLSAQLFNIAVNLSDRRPAAACAYRNDWGNVEDEQLKI